MAGDPGPAQAPIRAFLAIDVPPAEDGGPLVRLCGPVPKAYDRQHLTLRFFGALSGDDVERLIDECGRIKSPPFKLVALSPRLVDRGPKRRLLWAELEESVALTRLIELVDEAALKALGAPRDSRFLPHITMARPKEDLANLAELVKGTPSPMAEFEACELKLYRSTPAGGRHVHEFLFAWPFTGALEP